VSDFDLVIVGSGSGNALVTPDLDGWRIAIVEQGVFGGTCLNRGCIPTKMLVYAADRVVEAAHWGRLGLTGAAPAVDWAAIRNRVFGRVDPISAGGREYRLSGSPNVTLIEAHAEFAAPRTLRLSTGGVLTADQVVLATGARPDVPAVVADSGVPYDTSDTVMRIEDLPERLIVLGSGFVAVEFAHVFSGFGVDVTIAGRGPLLRRWAVVDRLHPAGRVGAAAGVVAVVPRQPRREQPAEQLQPVVVGDGHAWYRAERRRRESAGDDGVRLGRREPLRVGEVRFDRPRHL